jgi:hypothetical protein
VLIRVSTFVVTFAVALIGIFLHVDDLKVKIALACLALASLILAIFIEVQASREAHFTKRSLERLIQASTPSDLFARAVTKIAIDQAGKRGLSKCLVRRSEQDDGYVIEVIFTDEAEREAAGYFQFDHERLAQWSLLEEKNLSGEIAADMFTRGPAPTADLREHWNDLTEFIGEVATGLYPDSVRDGKYGIFANTEKVEIGIPYPRNVKTGAPERTRELPLDGESVLVLMFSKQELAALLTQSNIAASRTVADWLAAAWGTPTVLTRQQNLRHRRPSSPRRPPLGPRSHYPRQLTCALTWPNSGLAEGDAYQVLRTSLPTTARGHLRGWMQCGRGPDCRCDQAGGVGAPSGCRRRCTTDPSDEASQ